MTIAELVHLFRLREMLLDVFIMLLRIAYTAIHVSVLVQSFTTRSGMTTAFVSMISSFPHPEPLTPAHHHRLYWPDPEVLNVPSVGCYRSFPGNNASHLAVYP